MSDFAPLLIKEELIINISNVFGIEKGHTAIDFVDVDLNKDTKLYVDPTLIEYDESSIGRESHALINSYFDNVFDAIRMRDISRLEDLSMHAHEPNETRLGMSRNRPMGRGSSPDILMGIYQDIMDQRLLDDGLIKAPADIVIIVENFGFDRMSDLVTNIIKPALYRFTLEQCRMYEHHLGEKKFSLGYWWSPGAGTWGLVEGPSLMMNGKQLLLVPKQFVCKKMVKSPDEFFRQIIIPHLQEEHVVEDTSLVRRGVDAKGRQWTKPPYKQDVWKYELKKGSTKERIRAYVNRNFTVTPEYDAFTRYRVTNQEYSLSDEELDRIIYGISWREGCEA